VAESPLLKQVLLAVGAHPELRVWRNNTGQAWTGNDVFRAVKHGPVVVGPGDVIIRAAHPIRFGVPGSADIVGLKRGGQFVSIEVKDGAHGRLSEAQAKWGLMVKSLGGLWIVARSAEDALEVLK